jgi:dCTP diphosphatase
MNSLEDLKGEVLRFAAEREWEQFHTPKNLSTAVAVEAAELQELFMWLTPEQSRCPSPELHAKIEDEVGDILICLVNFAARTGIDPLVAAAQKIKKNGQKYPIEACRGRAKKYDEL